MTLVELALMLYVIGAAIQGYFVSKALGRLEQGIAQIRAELQHLRRP